LTLLCVGFITIEIRHHSATGILDIIKRWPRLCPPAAGEDLDVYNLFFKTFLIWVFRKSFINIFLQKKLLKYGKLFKLFFLERKMEQKILKNMF
jgi:hypothetical protein